MAPLDDEERELVDSYDQGDWRSINGTDIKSSWYRESARLAFEKIWRIWVARIKYPRRKD